MIQRIQSVYFLLAGILPAITFWCPLAVYTGPAVSEPQYVLSALGLLSQAEGGLVAYSWGILFFNLLSLVVAFYALFSYKNRRQQIRIGGWLISSLMLSALSLVAYGYSYAEVRHLDFMPYWGILLLFFSVFFAILGRRAVRKDEELVRAADRIR